MGARMGGMRRPEEGNGLREVGLGVGRIRRGCSHLGAVVECVARRAVQECIVRIEVQVYVVMARWADSLLVRRDSEGLELG